VQVVDHLARAGSALERVGAQRVADLAHRGRRLDPAPADVADHDPEAPAGELERVVPVAAGVVARVAGHIADDELVAGQLRERGREQRALQGRRRGVLAGEQAGVVERDPRPPADLLGELELTRGVLAAGLGPDERHRAERAAARGERHDHHRVHLQLADELDLLLVERGGLEQRAVDDGVELGSAGADDRGRAGRGVRIRRVALLQLVRPADLLRIDVGDGDRVAVVGELHRAPVRERGNGEAGDLLERLNRVQRLRQHLAGGVEEGVRLLALAALGDVAQQPGDALRAAVRLDRAGAGVQPAQALVREQDPQVHLIRRPVLQGLLDVPAHLLAILGLDDAVDELLDTGWLVAAREAVERSHVVGPLDDVRVDEPFPEAGLRPFQGEPQALFEASHGRSIGVSAQ
jgi:hypothetical protein